MDLGQRKFENYLFFFKPSYSFLSSSRSNVVAFSSLTLSSYNPAFRRYLEEPTKHDEHLLELLFSHFKDRNQHVAVFLRDPIDDM
jgi:hypothetical protein